MLEIEFNKSFIDFKFYNSFIDFKPLEAIVFGTHRQTLMWSCAAARKGTAPDRAWTSLCGNRCR